MDLPEDRWREPFTRDVLLPAGRVRVVFGLGALSRVAGEALALGGRVLLIAGPHEDIAAATVAERLGAHLVSRVREVAQHVPRALADQTVHRALQLDTDVLLAVGGGSATGLAKAVALQAGLPIVAVPSTYAGSEMTPIWGLSDQQGKTTGRDPRVLPRTVVYDPTLTTSLPAQVSGPSAMNALAHALEALYAPEGTGELAAIAEEAIRTLAASAPLVVTNPDDLAARAEALFGAWLAGWTLGAATMGLHHKLAHVLGGSYGLPHAGVHSALLPQVAAFNAPAAPEAFTRTAVALGVGDPDRVAPALFDLVRRVGAPTSLAELGLAEQALEHVAATVAAGAVANPRHVSKTDLVDLLRTAYAGTRPKNPEVRNP